MSKINLEDIERRFKTALKEKNTNASVVDKAIDENDLMNKFLSNQIGKEKINSLKELENHQKELIKFFYQVGEIIKAPSVNKFVEWLESLNINGIEQSARKNIAKILSDNYDEYDINIKSILDNKSIIENKASLFENIIKSVRLNILKRISDLGSKKNKIEDNLPDFIEELNDLLEGLSEIEELSFENVKDFYTNNLNEKDNNDYEPEIDTEADFYFAVIKQVVQKKDFLTKNQDKIKLSTIIEHINNNIKDIKDSIIKLKTIDIQNEKDVNISSLYNKFEKNLIFDTEKNNISGYLEKEISSTWEKTITAYNVCQDFYNNKPQAKISKLDGNKDKWLGYSFASKIERYILSLKDIISNNPINSLNNNDISKIKTAYSSVEMSIKSIEDTNPKDEVVNYFTAITLDYEEKNIGILIKLKTEDSEIRKIKNAVGEINSLIENIKKSENLLEALNDDLVDGILGSKGSYNYIKNEFNSAIENSIGKQDYQYFKELNEEGNVISKELLEEDLIIQRLKRLLENNLISINLVKNI